MGYSRAEKAKIFMGRFKGREDCYSVQKGKDYYPVCLNFGKAGCHRTSGEGKCACVYAPVTEQSTLRHIDGTERQNRYLVNLDGTVNFMAMDFDCKPGKEDEGYTFTDVSKVSSVLKGVGVPHMISRSTTNGFHIYIFMDKPYSALRSKYFLDKYVYEEVGFKEAQRVTGRRPPEIFPKQSGSRGADKVGNGISPPMQESRFLVGRNCVVDADDVVVGDGLSHEDMIEAQWKALDSVPRATPELLDSILAANDIEVFDDTIGGSRLDTNHIRTDKARSKTPKTASVEKVLEGCASFGRIRDKCARGDVPSYDEGVALYTLALNTSDGVDWFVANVPGWAKTEEDLKELQYYEDNNYLPYTCKTMQDKGLCALGTQCFKRKPPMTTIDGRLVECADTPESSWPSPSPIRYGYGKGEDFLKRLFKEVEDLKSETNEAARSDKLKEIIRRSKVFDDGQQKQLKDHIKKEKVIKAGEVNKAYKEVTTEAVEQNTQKNSALGHDQILVQYNRYRKLIPFGYTRVSLDEEGEVQDTVITDSCDIIITEERSYRDGDSRVEKAVYVGHAVTHDIDAPFEIDVSTWNDNGKLNDTLVAILGSRFNIIKRDIDFLRQAIIGFSGQMGIKRTSYTCMQGWRDGYYITPSVIVSKDGVHENVEQQVSLAHKEMARHLDFQLLPYVDMIDVLTHIKNDLLDAWPRKWTMIGLAHTFLPIAARPLGLKERPTLFYEGLSGTGKSAFTQMLQFFWGEFHNLTSLFNTTVKGAFSQVHEFKDALIVFDDFKDLTKEQSRIVRDVIQASYDGNTGVKLTKIGTQQTSKELQAGVAMTGEHFISDEASVVARTILIEEGKKINIRKTTTKFRKCWEQKHLYSGVTPHLIHFFLQESPSEYKTRLTTLTGELNEIYAGRQNAPRVSYNLALNHVLWRLFVDFMEHHSVISKIESLELIEEHKGYCYILMDEILARCEQEQNSLAFLDKLRELIHTGEVSIMGSERYYNDRKTVVGVIPDDDPYPGRDVIYVYPHTAVKEVARFMQATKGHIPGGPRSLGRDFMADGIIIDSDKGKSQKQVRIGDSRPCVWVMCQEKLGIAASRPRIVRSAPVRRVPINGAESDTSF